MSYTKVDPQPANLSVPLTFNGVTTSVPATAVTLDSGDIVAVAAKTGVHPTSGDPEIAAVAVAINADGSQRVDANGQTIASSFCPSIAQPDIDACGGIAAAQKCVLMAVLGEPTAPLWQDPSCAVMLANASIRTTLASAAHAGPVNTGSLL